MSHTGINKVNSNQRKIPAFLSALLVTGSVYGTFAVTEINQHAIVTGDTSTALTSYNVSTKQPPTSVYISAINKRLPIQASIVKDNNWQLFDTSVAWLSTSAVPNEGNVILYAHNWKSLWRDLYKLKSGDIIEVTANETIYMYKVIESRAVSKYDVEAVLSNRNLLTMYTCEGAFDQKRRVVYALPL